MILKTKLQSSLGNLPIEGIDPSIRINSGVHKEQHQESVRERVKKHLHKGAVSITYKMSLYSPSSSSVSCGLVVCFQRR